MKALSWADVLALGLILGWMAAPLSVEGQAWADFRTSRAAQGDGPLRVEVKYGAGQLTLSPSEGRQLYQLRMRYDETGFEPVHNYAPGRLEVGVTGTTTRRTSLAWGGNESELELALSRTVPIDLSVEFGAGRAEVELGGLRLTNLSMATGAATARIRVSSPNPQTLSEAQLQIGAASVVAEGLGNLRARELKVEMGAGDVTLDMGPLLLSESRLQVSMGVGSITIRVPDDVGVRVERSSFLASVSAPGFSREGNVLTSGNWGSTRTRLNVKVDAVLGSVTIVQGSR